ncbi:bifunctional N-acetylglucosamine-1-phosphate-uridyltransferase/glucosamine-1-phosphate-acetyltransferase GlmU-like protein [Clostridium sardiniense]|nr:bifunctional N-acetylglucosamine-1-phosphate-uridyltransferase/glucosamine-1-phosphate-acetyltransferase GlmU-like protein [Clostridium sardiniense]
MKNYNETIGVNSRLQLAETEKILRDKINKKHLENGVTLIDPASTYIGIDVEIGKDTIVYPGVILEGNEYKITMDEEDIVNTIINKIGN